MVQRAPTQVQVMQQTVREYEGLSGVDSDASWAVKIDQTAVFLPYRHFNSFPKITVKPQKLGVERLIEVN
jgi:hypothetical protein